MIIFRSQGIRFRLDRHAGQLWREKKQIHLARKEFELLRHLAENPGKLVGKAELQDAVWGTGGANGSDDVVGKAVNKVRHALGDRADRPLFIETVPGSGYRFVAEIKSVLERPRIESPRHRAAAEATQEHRDPEPPAQNRQNLTAQTLPSAFFLGQMIIYSANAASISPRDEEGPQDLWRSIEGMCGNLRIETPPLPGRYSIIDSGDAMVETLQTAIYLMDDIEERYGSLVAKPFWLGVKSASALHFVQRPELIQLLPSALDDIEDLVVDCSIPDEAVRPYLDALESRDPEAVADAALPFGMRVGKELQLLSEAMSGPVTG